MVAYAKAHKLKVIPLCPYVYAELKGTGRNMLIYGTEK